MATEDDPFKIEPGLLSPQNTNVSALPVAETTNTTLNNQDWAKGDLKLTSSGNYFTPANATDTGAQNNDTVERRLSGLLANESPYMLSARTKAQQQANQRGLLNSTMAATAGEKAAIETALPIAQQDASYYQAQGINAQQGDIQKGLYETQGNISSQLAEEKFTYDQALKNADIEWNKIDLRARMDVEFARMSEENKKMFNETMNTISDDYMADYTEIMLNPNFASGEQRTGALNVLSYNTQQRYRIAGDIAGFQLEWEIPTEQTGATATSGYGNRQAAGPVANDWHWAGPTALPPVEPVANSHVWYWPGPLY